MKKMKKSDDELLLRIARYLMLQNGRVTSLGLLNGKMGIALFFYHYGRYSGQRTFDDFAGELIDEIYENTSKYLPLSFKDGISGIAWGIEYLIRNGFVEANPDDTLDELDQRISEWNVRQITDVSLDMGLVGLSHYVLSRCGNRDYQNSRINKSYIIDLLRALEDQSEKINDNDYWVVEQLRTMLEGKPTINCNQLLSGIIIPVKYRTCDLFVKERSLGIVQNGYAGIGLKLIWEKY